MSKKIYLFSLVLLALAFTACSETEETGKYDNWQARNEAFIDSIANAHANTATRGQLDSIHMIAYPGVPIYFKKKTPVGDGVIQNIWGIERSGFFNGREKWAKGFENQRV